MHNLLRIAAALVLLSLALISCANAETDIAILSETHPPEAIPRQNVSPYESFGEIDPIVSEVEYLFGNEDSGNIICDAEPSNEAAESLLYAEAESANNISSIPSVATDDVQKTGEYTDIESTPDLSDTGSEPIPQILRLGIGEKYSLPGIDGTGAWLYKSSNKRVATVSADGVIKGRKRGQARIIKSDGETVIEYTVKVAKAPKYIKFARKKLKLVFDSASSSGEQFQLSPKLSSKSSSQICYYGYDRKIVSVSESGLVTAVGPGTTVVKAKTFNKKKSKIKITVTDISSNTASLIQTDQTKIIAHRGSAYWEENTLMAFQNFASTGADAVELDARSCLDGTQVIFHDPSFKVKGTRYKVSELTLEQLRKLKPSICTLDEALEVIAASEKEIFLELKETADGAKCVSSIQTHGLESRTIFFSFFEKTLKQVYSSLPSAVLGLSLKGNAKPYSKALLEKAKKLHLSCFIANKKLMSKKVVKHWHSKGYAVYVWTVNGKSTMRALEDMGADGIVTDYPERCVQALAR